MVTLQLPNYSYDAAISRALARPKETSSHSTGYSGPSPFEVPESVRLVIKHPNQLLFKFDYADQDELESSDRSATNDGTIAVRLGEKSKKIRQFIFYRDIDDLWKSLRLIDQKLIFSNENRPSTQSLNAFRENVLVIKDILSSLPEEFVTHVKHLVKEVADTEQHGSNEEPR